MNANREGDLTCPASFIMLYSTPVMAGLSIIYDMCYRAGGYTGARGLCHAIGAMLIHALALGAWDYLILSLLPVPEITFSWTLLAAYGALRYTLECFIFRVPKGRFAISSSEAKVRIYSVSLGIECLAHLIWVDANLLPYVIFFPAESQKDLSILEIAPQFIVLSCHLAGEARRGTVHEIRLPRGTRKLATGSKALIQGKTACADLQMSRESWYVRTDNLTIVAARRPLT